MPSIIFRVCYAAQLSHKNRIKAAGFNHSREIGSVETSRKVSAECRFTLAQHLSKESEEGDKDKKKQKKISFKRITKKQVLEGRRGIHLNTPTWFTQQRTKENPNPLSSAFDWDFPLFLLLLE